MKVEEMTPHESTWTPILWALKLLERARSEGKIKMDPPIYGNLVSRAQCYKSFYSRNLQNVCNKYLASITSLV
jgi:hypothetical protein